MTLSLAVLAMAMQTALPARDGYMCLFWPEGERDNSKVRDLSFVFQRSRFDPIDLAKVEILEGADLLGTSPFVKLDVAKDGRVSAITRDPEGSLFTLVMLKQDARGNFEAGVGKEAGKQHYGVCHPFVDVDGTVIAHLRKRAGKKQ